MEIERDSRQGGRELNVSAVQKMLYNMGRLTRWSKYTLPPTHTHTPTHTICHGVRAMKTTTHLNRLDRGSLSFPPPSAALVAWTAPRTARGTTPHTHRSRS